MYWENVTHLQIKSLRIKAHTYADTVILKRERLGWKGKLTSDGDGVERQRIQFEVVKDEPLRKKSQTILFTH